MFDSVHCGNSYMLSPMLLVKHFQVAMMMCCMIQKLAALMLRPAGVLSGELGSSLGGAALVMSCGAAGLACGLPLWLMPAPLLAGSGIALFYDSGSLRDYCLFSAGTFATGLWFLHHHYWFLNIQVQAHGLRFLCQVILAALIPATLLPGLVMGQGSKSLVGLLMLGQVGHQPPQMLIFALPCSSMQSWHAA